MIFSPQEGIALDTGDTEVGAGKVTVSADIEGKEDNIGVNSVYLLDVLNVIREDYVSISFETNLSPVLVQPHSDTDTKTSGYRHIIMPLKI